MIEKGQRIKAEDVKQGLTAWDPSIGYQKNATCYYEDEDNNIPYALYRNLTGTNNPLANPAQDTINWEELEFGGGGGLEIGDIGIVTLPIKEEKLRRRYLNGQLILQSEFVAFTRKLKSAIQTYPNLVCTEEEWQATVTASKVGQCGKFVIDDDNGTIRLPKVVRIQGQLTLANIGDIVDESLPNIKGASDVGGFSGVGTSPYGSFSNTDLVLNTTFSTISQNNTNIVTFTFDASKTSSTYQDGAPVQEEAVQYPYFIQVASGSEEEIDPVREIEFNNPFYFGMYKWSEIIPANLSWLEANNTFQDSTVYVDFYDWILKNQSGTIASGISVKNSDEVYTDYDFVIDVANQTFRLPTKTAIRELIAVKEPTSVDPSWYRLYSDGWCEQGGIISKFTNTGANTGYPNIITLPIKMQDTNYDVRATLRANDNSLSNVSGWSHRVLLAIPASVNNIQIDQYVNSTASGTQTYASWEVKGYAASDASTNLGLKLYWYVGETVQNANLINAANLFKSSKEFVDEKTEEIKDLTEDNINKLIDEGNKQWAKVNMEGLHIFDIVQKDHVLSFAESNGFAPLGSYVWKEATDGRYGYPDFYSACLAEYNNSTEGGYLASNIEKVGSLTDTLGVLSGFSTSQYAIVNNAVTGTFSPTNNTWEICLKITTGNNVSTKQYYFNSKDIYAAPIELYIESTKFKIGLSSNGASGDIATAVAGTYTVLANTTYWIKIIFDGTKYVFSYSLDGENFTNDITKASSTAVLSGKIPVLGIDYNGSTYNAPFLGSIDLTQCYIKIAGEYWWKGIRRAKVNSNGHMYYDIVDKPLVDAIYANTGNAWMYGIDTENERVFLPKGYSSRTPSLMNYYMIVGSVKEETAIGEYTDITTTENDTIPLFTHKYFEHKPNHISWVPANTVKDGNEYLTAYNTLVNCLTDNPFEIKVINESDMESGVDYSEYWILNQDNVTFRTPITVSEKALNGAIKGNSISLGLTNGVNNYGLATRETSSNFNVVGAFQSTYGLNVQTPRPSGANPPPSSVLGVTTDPTKSGIIAEQSTSLLYFKVANAVQNLELIDAGRIEENKLNTNLQNVDLTSGADTIIDRQEPTAANNYTWYRLYKSGWVEQGGQFTEQGGQYSVYEVPLPITMLNTNYYANGIVKYASADTTLTISIGSTKTTTSVLGIRKHWNSAGQTVIWEVKGMSAI